MVPVVTLVAWLFWGVEAVSSALSDPTGRDPEDLPFDLMTAELRAEVEWTMENLPEGDDTRERMSMEIDDGGD